MSPREQLRGLMRRESVKVTFRLVATQAGLDNHMQVQRWLEAPHELAPSMAARVEGAVLAWLATRSSLYVFSDRERARVNKPRPVREEYRAFAGRVVIALERAGMTRCQLAERARVSVGQVSRFVKAKAMPLADVALRLADALGVSLTWLVSGRGPMRATDAGDA